MKTIPIILLALTSCILFSMEQKQDMVTVICADKDKYSLPLWQIIESTTLHKLFLKEEYNQKRPLKRIETACVSSGTLKLYSQALHVPLTTFDDYYHKKLNSVEQQVLLHASGEKCLNSAYLITQLTAARFHDNITDHILPYIDLTDCIDSIRYNISYYTIDCQLPKTSENVDTLLVTAHNYDGLCSFIPSLMDNNPYYTSLIIPPTITNPNDKTYLVEYIQQRADEPSTSYFITPITTQFEQSDNSKKFVWINKNNISYPIIAELEHPYPIKGCQFSYDGKFLATFSNTAEWNNVFDLTHQEESYLILMTLGIKQNGSDCLYTISDDYIGNIVSVSFNPQSTLLAVATTNGVYIWNTKGILKKHLIDIPYHHAKAMSWNHEGTTLVVLTGENPTQSLSSKLFFYDTCNNYSIKNIIPIVHGFSNNILLQFGYNIILIPIEKNNSTGSYPFNFDELLDNSFYWQLYKMENTNAMLVLDATTGAFIGFLENPTNDLYNTDCLISPNGKFLVIALVGQLEPTTITIYDFISKQQTIIPTELICITGIGFSSDERSIIITTTSNTHHYFDLYNENTAACLEWIKNKSSLMQRYVLYRWYVAYQQKERLSLHPQSPILQALKSLPTEPLNIKKFIENLETVFIKNTE